MSDRLHENAPFIPLAHILAWLSTFGAPKTVHSVWCEKSTTIFPKPMASVEFSK